MFILAIKNSLHIPDEVMFSEMSLNNQNPLLTQIAEMNEGYGHFLIFLMSN